MRVARRVGRRVAVHLAAIGVRDDDGLAARRELSFIAANDEQTLTATRAGGAGLEAVQITRDVEQEIGRKDRARPEGEVHGTADFPAGDVERVGRGVRDADVFLQLVAAGRIGLHRKDFDYSVGRLRQRDAGIARRRDADGFGGVGDAVRPAEMDPAQVDELIEQFIHRDIERLVGRRPSGVAPFGTVEGGFGPNNVRHVPDVRFQQARLRSHARLHHPAIQHRALAAQQHLAGFRKRDDRVVDAIVAASVAGNNGGTAIERVALAVVGDRVQRSDAAVALTPGGVHVERNAAPQAIAKGIAVDGHVRPHVVVLSAPPCSGEVVDDLRNIHHVVGGSTTLGQVGRLSWWKVGLVDGAHECLIIGVVGERFR